MTAAATPPGDIVLATPDGTAVPLTDLAADPLVAVLVRFYGCLPCQQFVQEVSAARDQLPNGARVVAIGGSADYQARWLAEEKGVAMPLLLDPEQQVRALVDLGDLTAGQMLSGRGMAAYARSMVGGRLLPKAPTQDATKAPGVAILGPDLSVQWVHRGTALGDYPTVPELLARVEELALRSP